MLRAMPEAKHPRAQVSSMALGAKEIDVPRSHPGNKARNGPNTPRDPERTRFEERANITNVGTIYHEQ